MHVGNLTGSGGTIRNNTSSTVATFVIGNGNSGGGNFQGIIQDGAGGAQVALTKTGSGKITLSGANTYTGVTNIDGGTLAIDGTSGTTPINVNNNGTLGGSGAINGATALFSGGKLSPGDSPGVETFNGELSFNSGSSYDFELTANTMSGRGTNFDGVTVAGGTLTTQSGVTANLIFNISGSSVDWSDALWSAAQSWLVFDNTNTPSVSGSIFDAINTTPDAQGDNLSSVGAGASFNFLQDINGDIYLQYNVVPEPTPKVLLVAAIAAIFVGNRHRRAKSATALR